MKTKNRIEIQLRKKRNQELVDTIIAAKKSKEWLPVASLLTGSRRNKISINLKELDENIEAGKMLVVPGKVLSVGELSKKTKIVALSFSGKAKEKIIKSGSEAINIFDEIKKNSKATGIKIVK